MKAFKDMQNSFLSRKTFYKRPFTNYANLQLLREMYASGYYTMAELANMWEVSQGAISQKLSK